jgi:hypothetical protein
VREPLEKLEDNNVEFDIWEIILYVMGLSFVIEGMSLKFGRPLISIFSSL